MFTVYLKSVVVNFIYLFLNFSLMGFSCSLRALRCGVWALWVESSASRAGLISYCMGLVGYSMQNLNSPTRDQTCVPCIGKQILNHRTTREVPMNFFFFFIRRREERSRLTASPRFPSHAYPVPSLFFFSTFRQSLASTYLV